MLGVLTVIVLIALWQRPLRIQTVVATGPASGTAEEVARDELRGTYAFLIPRSSTFFFPEQQIRARVLAADPGIAAVSLRRTSFTSLSVVTSGRAASFLWCGELPDSGSPCYPADAQGLVFAAADLTVSTSSPSLPRLHAPLAEGADASNPAGARIAHADNLMNVLKLVRAIESLGIDVAYTTLAGDEAELRTAYGTRLRYVIGREEEAAATAASALPPLDIPSGTYEYVDLRFPGKAYAKRFGE